jgi:hypothetical protein
MNAAEIFLVIYYPIVTAIFALWLWRHYPST